VKKLAPILFLFALTGAVVACSSDEPTDETDSTQPTLPQSDGDQCEDPIGDLTSDAQSPGVGSEPAGVDITSAKATVREDELAVSITTAGPIDQAPGTTFAVAQGTPYTSVAFEIRATAGDGDEWDVEIITWDDAEKRTSVPIRPTVTGNTLSFEVPLEALPTIGLYLQFGGSAAVEGVGRVFDDCSSLTTATTTP
jgi:hypothetical protein